MMTRAGDISFMRAALMLARRNLGNTWPNPAVGCVLVREDIAAEPVIVGRGWTERGGRPHAETEAIARAGKLAPGATAFITLEPCAHHGQTPPCTEALVKAGVARAVIGIEDPDPRVAGLGLAALKAAELTIEVGVEREAAAALARGHIKRIKQGLPMVTLKLATTLDGRIATQARESKWITGPEARAAGHRLRAEHDAVLIGSETAVLDNPQLTCRLCGMAGRSPVRIIADGRLRLSLTSAIATSAHEVPTWVLTRQDAPAPRRAAFASCGMEIIEIGPGEEGSLDIKLALERVAARGITRVLAEGGARLAAALMKGDLVDEIVWFRAATIMGGDGLAAIDGFGLSRLADIRRFERVEVRVLGEDLVETYARAA